VSERQTCFGGHLRGLGIVRLITVHARVFAVVVRLRLPLVPRTVRWTVVLFVASMIVYASVVATPTGTPESGPVVTAPTRAGVVNGDERRSG
jgi:hypothetical protein